MSLEEEKVGSQYFVMNFAHTFCMVEDLEEAYCREYLLRLPLRCVLLVCRLQGVEGVEHVESSYSQVQK